MRTGSHSIHTKQSLHGGSDTRSYSSKGLGDLETELGKMPSLHALNIFEEGCQLGEANVAADSQK